MQCLEVSGAVRQKVNRVLWQHVVLCKSTLLRMRLAMVCVMSHDAHHSQAHSQQCTLTQHDMLPQHPINIKELFCECF